MGDDRQPVVRMSAITKRFLDVTANNEVTFELYPGEICALLGEKRRRQNHSYEHPLWLLRQ